MGKQMRVSILFGHPLLLSVFYFPKAEAALRSWNGTGYPKLFTVVNNSSNGAIDTQVQIRRLAYPVNEYSTNGA